MRRGEERRAEREGEERRGERTWRRSSPHTSIESSPPPLRILLARILLSQPALQRPLVESTTGTLHGS